MSTLTIKLDDEAARLVAQAAQTVNQTLEEWVQESLCQAAARAVNVAKPSTRRISPLHPGAMTVAPDFNAPLEEFAAYV